MNLAFLFASAWTATAAGIAVDLYRYAGRRVQSQPDPDDIQTPSGDLTGKTTIITHHDFDGFASGALLYRIYGSSSNLLLSSPRRLKQVLHKASMFVLPQDTIVIADLALPFQDEIDIAAILTSLRKRNVRVVWFDHHPWPAGLLERISQLVSKMCLDPLAHTAAEMIRGVLPADDRVADEILAVISRKELPSGNEEWRTGWRSVLSELTHRKDQELTAAVLRKMAEGEDLGLSETALALKHLNRERKVQETARYGHRVELTAAGRKCLVIDLRRRRLETDETGRIIHVIDWTPPGIMTAMEACRFHNAEMCLVLWQDFRYSIYRGTERELSFKNLLGGLTVEGTRYSISGHDYASSITVEPPLKSFLKMWFQWTPPLEFEKLVSTVKRQY